VAPEFFYDNHRWKVFSGKWEVQASGSIQYLTEPRVTTGENLAIAGSPSWDQYQLDIKCKILTGSLKPPEGGAILYYFFKNINNYYSFHICIYKRKLEIIKRVQGAWSTIAEYDYDFIANEDYPISINVNSGIHQFMIDGHKQLEIIDNDISRGCVGIGAKYCDVEFSHVSVSIPQ